MVIFREMLLEKYSHFKAVNHLEEHLVSPPREVNLGPEKFHNLKKYLKLALNETNHKILNSVLTILKTEK